jgi:hypothetical protein
LTGKKLRFRSYHDETPQFRERRGAMNLCNPPAKPEEAISTPDLYTYLLLP